MLCGLNKIISRGKLAAISKQNCRTEYVSRIVQIWVVPLSFEVTPKNKIYVIFYAEAVFMRYKSNVCHYSCNCDQIMFQIVTLMYSIKSCTVSMLYIMLCESLSDHENRDRLQPVFQVH